MKNKGINVYCRPSTSRVLKLVVNKEEPIDLIDEMISEIAEACEFNRYDLTFWVIALENLAAAFKSGFRSDEKESYDLLRRKIQARIEHVYLSKDVSKEDFDGNDT